MLLADWPTALNNYLSQTYGRTQDTELLSGLSGAKVYRVRLDAASVIIKCSPKAREYTFYNQIAPLLRAQGVAIPDLYWCAQLESLHWLVMEALPHKLPRDRWGADAGMLSMLGKLHEAAVPIGVGLLDLYRPKWTPDMTSEALSCLPAERDALAPILERIRQQYQGIFERAGPISGDTNVNNWGLREDGTLVLFDWERFALGTPAIDVGIVVPGLRNAAFMRHIAHSYLAARTCGEDEEIFAREIAAAKVWSVVEFINEFVGGATELEPAVSRILPVFPEWVKELGL